MSLVLRIIGITRVIWFFSVVKFCILMGAITTGVFFTIFVFDFGLYLLVKSDFVLLKDCSGIFY